MRGGTGAQNLEGEVLAMWVGGDTGNFSATAKRLYVHPAYANRVRSLLEAGKRKGPTKNIREKDSCG